MDKAIVFGLENKEAKIWQEIRERYVIVGVSDLSDERRSDFAEFRWIEPASIPAHDFDKIILMRGGGGAFAYLTQELRIAPSSIQLFVDANEFHGQTGEDFKLLSIFHFLGMEPSQALYLELGTNDPINLNNTYYFYRHGARGVLVEPNLRLRAWIEFVRPDDKLISKAVDAISGKRLTFYELQGDVLSTTDIEKISDDAREKYSAFAVMNNYEVETIAVNDILREMPRTPDIMSIDIEGSDLKVLQAIDYTNYAPKIIVAELFAWGSKEQSGPRIIEFMRSKGYALSCVSSDLNGIFLRQDIASLVESSWRTFFQNCDLTIIENAKRKDLLIIENRFVAFCKKIRRLLMRRFLK